MDIEKPIGVLKEPNSTLIRHHLWYFNPEVTVIQKKWWQVIAKCVALWQWSCWYEHLSRMGEKTESLPHSSHWLRHLELTALFLKYHLLDIRNNQALIMLTGEVKRENFILFTST